MSIVYTNNKVLTCSILEEHPLNFNINELNVIGLALSRLNDDLSNDELCNHELYDALNSVMNKIRDLG